MALDMGGLVMPLQPLHQLDFGTGQSRYALEQLKLQRAQLEETKRRNAELAEQKRMAEAAIAARNAAQQQRLHEEEQAKLEQAQAQETQKQKIAAYQEALKYADAGNYEGMQQMVPLMTQLGMGVELQGTDGQGLPRYQIDLDAAKAAEQKSQEWEQGAHPIDDWDGNQGAAQSLDVLNGLGYPRNETGTLDEPAGIGSTEEAFAQAQAAQGQPAKPPDPTDWTGATPSNVIDFGAQHESAARRLNPALAGLAAAYPTPELQRSATETAGAVQDLALPPGASIEAFKGLRTGPDSAVNAAAQRQMQQDNREGFTEKQKRDLYGKGAGYGKSTFAAAKVQPWLAMAPVARSIEESLSNPSKADDAYVFSPLMALQGVKGTPSDRDLNLILGINMESTLEQAVDWLGKHWNGGMQSKQKEAVLNYVRQQSAIAQDQIFNWLDSTENTIKYDPLTEWEADGIRGFRDGVARSSGLYNQWRDRWEKNHPDEAEEAAAPVGPTATTAPISAKGGDLEDELMLQAYDAGLDYEQILPLMRTESGGDPTAKNRMGSSAAGLFQFTDETAQKYGLKSADEYAALPPDQQIALAIRRFKDIGLGEGSGRDDFALANAAPAYVGKPDDTVIAEYKAGTKFGDDVRAKNPGWIPPGGGDITVGSIKAFYRGGKAGEQSAESEEEKRARQLLGGGR